MVNKMNTLTKKVQIEEYIGLEDLKPRIENGGIFFPVSAEHVNLDKYNGDARSFGYNFDDGSCTVAIYEQAVGALADDTVALFDDCAAMKKHMKKPTHHILEIDDNNTDECDSNSSELLIRYDSEYFYKDGAGFWFKAQYYCHGEPQRVTNDSAEIYREVNKEYQRSIVKYNGLMKEALENMDMLKEAVA